MLGVRNTGTQCCAAGDYAVQLRWTHHLLGKVPRRWCDELGFWAHPHAQMQAVLTRIQLPHLRADDPKVLGVNIHANAHKLCTHSRR